VINNWHSLAIEMVRRGRKVEALEAVEQLVALFAACPFQEGEKFLAQYSAIRAQLLEDSCCFLEVRESLEAMTEPTSRFVAGVLQQLGKDAAELGMTVVDVIEANSLEELVQKVQAAELARQGKTNLAALHQVCLN